MVTVTVTVTVTVRVRGRGRVRGNHRFNKLKLAGVSGRSHSLGQGWG